MATTDTGIQLPPDREFVAVKLEDGSIDFEEINVIPVDDIVDEGTLLKEIEDKLIGMSIEDIPLVEDKPLSKLKQQRLKEKRKKENRKMEKAIKAVTEKKISASDRSSSKWSENKNEAMKIWGALESFAQIATAAIGLLNDPNIIIDDVTKSQVYSRVTVYTGDIDNFKRRWQEISEKIEGKSGFVSGDELPFFLVIFEDYLILEQEILNVLTEQANTLRYMTTSIIEKIQEKLTESETVK